MYHEPVLLREAIGHLATERGGLFVDCTLGTGGHAAELLSATDVRLVGIDRDPQALAIAERRLAPFGERVRTLQGDFRDLESLLHGIGVERIDGGVLADLGVSSLQLDTAARGFSFRREGPLDMRMGTHGQSARDIVNSYSEAELTRIFREYGEERQARRIARKLIDARSEVPIETTSELKKLVARAKGARGAGSFRIDPATRVFQALRIEVNRELEGLEALLDQAVRLLDQDGRLVVISYHSLEDRIVKHTFRRLAQGEVDQITGRSRSETRILEVLTRKPVRPGEAEVAVNPRSRSARLRAVRRL